MCRANEKEGRNAHTSCLFRPPSKEKGCCLLLDHNNELPYPFSNIKDAKCVGIKKTYVHTQYIHHLKLLFNFYRATWQGFPPRTAAMKTHQHVGPTRPWIG